jgi:CTP:molybdopterin cytidylyltransferase MocA
VQTRCYIVARILLRLPRRSKAKPSRRKGRSLGVVRRGCIEVVGAGFSPATERSEGIAASSEPSAKLEFANQFLYPAPAPRMRKLEKIIPIILAAGNSPELLFPKALALFGKKTALQIAVENCRALGRPVVVLGSQANRILPEVPKSCQAVINRNWRKGQLSSLQQALKSIPADAAFLIYPVDHPLLKRTTLSQLIRAFRNRTASQEIVMPRHRKAYGHPVIVSAIVRPEFFKAQTAREVIYLVPKRLLTLNIRTSSIFEDFNSQESYERCVRKFQARK